MEKCLLESFSTKAPAYILLTVSSLQTFFIALNYSLLKLLRDVVTQFGLKVRSVRLTVLVI